MQVLESLTEVVPLQRERRIALAWLASSLDLNHSTVYRWVTIGVNGIKLESFRLGGRRFTTHEAYARWMTRTNWETLHTNGRMKGNTLATRTH